MLTLVLVSDEAGTKACGTSLSVSVSMMTDTGLEAGATSLSALTSITIFSAEMQLCSPDVPADDWIDCDLLTGGVVAVCLKTLSHHELVKSVRPLTLA